MDARGNKLSSCKIPNKSLKKQKSNKTFRTLANLADEKKKKKRIAHTIELLSQLLKGKQRNKECCYTKPKKNSEYNRVDFTTLKKWYR